MTTKPTDAPPGWTDPDDAPDWSDDVIERAALRDGDRLVTPVKGTLTRLAQLGGSEPHLVAPPRRRLPATSR